MSGRASARLLGFARTGDGYASVKCESSFRRSIDNELRRKN